MSQNFLLSMQATGAATEALFSIGMARLAAPGVISAQDSVKLLCQTLRHLQQHVYPPKPVAKIHIKKPDPPPQWMPAIPDPSPMRVDHPLAVQEVNGCKALLLEVIRRAAYDWVLYRTSSKIPFKKLAEDAYYWLFVEDEGHARWIERMMNQKSITSFVAICQSLDLDVDSVRHHIRKLTIKNVMSVGRPAEYRWNTPREVEDRTVTSYEDVALFSMSEHDDSFLTEELPINPYRLL